MPKAKKYLTHRATQKSGIALIELSLVIPILLLLFFGSLEFGRILRYQQVLSNFSRELAGNSLRECRNSPNANCLNNVITEVSPIAQAQLPGVSLGISLWRWDNTDPNNPTCLQTGTTASNGFASRFDAADFQSAALSQICQDFQSFDSTTNQALPSASVAIGESQFYYEPLVPVLGPLFRISPQNLYVVSIY